MKAGAAKVAITPAAASLKELTTVMGTKATQIDHDIYARALGPQRRNQPARDRHV